MGGVVAADIIILLSIADAVLSCIKPIG